MKTRGFTLIELLGVIIILALLIALTFPSIINFIKSSSNDKDNLVLDLVYNATEKFIEDDKSYYIEREGNSYCVSLTDLIESGKLKGPITISDEDVTNKKSVQITYNGKFNYELKDNNNCITKIQPNKPDLLNNTLTPIKYNGSSWIVVDGSKTDWYDYENQEWANAVLLEDHFKSNTVNGATKQNGYASFDGTDDYMDIGLENYDFGKNITFAIRFRPKSVSSSHYEIFGNWEVAGGGIAYSSNYIRFGLYIKENNAYSLAEISMTVNPNTWYTVVATYDGSTMKLYVNGSLKVSTAVSGSIKPSTVPISLGANPGPTGYANYSNADVETIDIYNRALTETEIKNGYSGEIKVQNEDKLLKHIDFTTPKVGEIVPEVAMKAMFVWIPRYEYKIDGTYGKGGTSADAPGEIEVNFVSQARTKASEGYRVHPAFKFGIQQLSGIWAGKFETTGTGDDPTILPGVSSLREQTVSVQFTTAQKFNTYITNGDSHMMKNSEWGAVAYFSQSKYGKYGNSNYSGAEKEVRANNCSSYITGIGANLQDTSNSSSTCTTNTYKTSNGQAASTTGNITGVYDMSGGSWEYVMGVYSKIISSSGFSKLPDAKYYDNYISTTIAAACDGGVCYGHALSETSGWYGDRAIIYSSPDTWIHRGSSLVETKSNMGVFSYSCNTGRDHANVSFRVALTPNL